MTSVARTETMTETIEQPTTGELQGEMEETLTLVLEFKDRVDHDETISEEEQEEVVRRFSDLAGLLASGMIISGETMIVLGHILDAMAFMKYGLDMTLFAAPLMALHLILRFWILQKVAHGVDVSEAKLDEWEGEFTGPHGALTIAEREAKQALEGLKNALNVMLKCESGSIPVSASMSLRGAILKMKSKLENYDAAINRGQTQLKQVLAYAEDTRARVKSSKMTSGAGIVTSGAALAASVGATIATGGLAAVAGVVVAGAGVVGNGYMLDKSCRLERRNNAVLEQIEQNQQVLDNHRKIYDNLVEEIQKELDKGEDTIRREKAFLAQRAEAEQERAEKEAAMREAESARLAAQNAKAAVAAKDAELEMLRRMLAEMQNKNDQ